MGNTMKPLTKEEDLSLEELLDEVAYTSTLMVYNDDVNTFDWVIESLVKVCNHTYEQAEQCAIYIHFKGKYAVKHGSEIDLIPMKDALLDRGITAQVENL
ncbi:MAG: ATP-dependent Clp protease adaptor ClpS [Chitinophagales bacterium]|nr:ATP-dependent Clp protease adaptor ClpS [Chitinophagales bacterium]